MPGYHVNQIYKGHCIVDQEGADFPDLAAVRHELILAARQIMANRLMKGEEPDHSRFEVFDENGQLTLTLAFSDAYQNPDGDLSR
jgi:hypothetical protein